MGVHTPHDVLKRCDRAILLVHVVQARDLDQPAHVVRVELVVDDPLCELVPLVALPAVDANAPFAVLTRMAQTNAQGQLSMGTHLILALLQIGHDLCGRYQYCGITIEGECIPFVSSARYRP